MSAMAALVIVGRALIAAAAPGAIVAAWEPIVIPEPVDVSVVSSSPTGASGFAAAWPLSESVSSEASVVVRSDPSSADDV